jgi:RNA polymerase sigma-70 factor (ECF subfamily)
VAQQGSNNLEHLLQRIGAKKDQKAFDELYSATKGKLFYTVLLIVRRQDVAEEIIQDVYLRIWSNVSSYHSPLGSPMTWMISIARHMAIDYLRKSARETRADDSLLLSVRSESPTAIEIIEASEEERYASEQQRKVLWALQALNPDRRDLVVRAYLYGESRAQLSERTGVPINTVKTWIRRALLEVAATLQPPIPERAFADSALTVDRSAGAGHVSC